MKIKIKSPKYGSKFMLIDDEDYHLIQNYKLYICKFHNKFYAFCYIKNNKYIRVHRLIMNISSKNGIDHINGNGLDNRKCNLRICNQSQNMSNRGFQKNNKSGYKGVSWDKSRQKWKVDITVNRKKVYVGRFNCKHEAANVYNEMAIKYHKEFAKLNNIKMNAGKK